MTGFPAFSQMGHLQAGEVVQWPAFTEYEIRVSLLRKRLSCTLSCGPCKIIRLQLTLFRPRLRLRCDAPPGSRHWTHRPEGLFHACHTLHRVVWSRQAPFDRPPVCASHYGGLPPRGPQRWPRPCGPPSPSHPLRTPPPCTRLQRAWGWLSALGPRFRDAVLVFIFASAHTGEAANVLECL